MKLYNYISALLIAGIASFSSCSQEENLNGVNGIDSSNSIKISVSDGGFFDTTPGTRATENGYTTEFADGDAIGIFGVDASGVVADINNRKYTMKNGNWEVEGNPVEYKGEEFKRMTFYAYYPYSVNVKFDATHAEDPFAEYVKEWTLNNNQGGKEYTKYDLMTSSSAAVVDNRFKGEIKFEMQHRMALVVLKMPKLVYDFVNTDVTLDDYELPIANASFTLNGTEATPFYEEGTETYRFLVKPDVEFSIDGTYTGVKEMTYTATATLNKGIAKVYTINDTNKKEYTLAIGDYYCADGSIVSKEAETVPENVIGIVCYVGNPQPSITHPGNNTETNDALRRDYPDCKHGLILALNNTSETAGKFSSWRDTNTAYCDWLSKDEEWADKFVDCNTANSSTLWENKYPAFMGYNNTMLLTMCYEGKGSQGMCDDAYNQIINYRNTVIVPANTTPWYLPSISCLDQVAKNLSAVNSSLGKVTSATQMQSVDNNASSGFYWSSTLRNGYTTWVHAMSGGNYNKSNSYGSIPGYFRMMLAF
ncbi:fimbrillin family protein [uncultured Bacteroides sp.]|uniref:fimbrillin family protein n=1 Tax=uncultured Bacteroides sp. TaxID=162156 RepID=UPI0025EBD7D6|nr:fimbrillin family protein [uncultured Bacteroides sp.]